MFCILIDFSSYVLSLPVHARPHLEQQLDHDGVEIDLCEIADHMLDWEEKLANYLGLTHTEKYDILKDIRLHSLALQRWETSRRKLIKVICMYLLSLKHVIALTLALCAYTFTAERSICITKFFMMFHGFIIIIIIIIF